MPLKGESKYSNIDKEVAFLYYYQLGESRSLKDVSKKFEAPMWLIKKWSQDDKWAEKISKDDDLIKEAKGFEKKAGLLYTSKLAVYSLCKQIIDDPNARAGDKLKAAEYLMEIGKGNSDLKEKLKIAIKVENLEEAIKRLKDLGIKTIV